MTAGFYSMHSLGYSPWICTNIPPNFGAQTEGNAWVLLKSFSSKLKIFWNFHWLFWYYFHAKSKTELKFIFKIFQRNFWTEKPLFFPCFYLPGSLPCRGSWKIPLFHSPCGPCCPSTGWFQHSWSGERKEVKHSLKYSLDLLDLCRKLQFVSRLHSQIIMEWFGVEETPKLIHGTPWGNSGWLSQICQNPHSFSAFYPGKQQNIPLGCAVGGLVLLTFDFHPFPWMWAQEEPPRAGHESLMLPQLGGIKSCPNLSWKAGKHPKNAPLMP